MAPPAIDRTPVVVHGNRLDVVRVPLAHRSTTAGVVISHGFPPGPPGMPTGLVTLADLAERLAVSIGCPTVTFTSSGVGDSSGSFSLARWLDDLRGMVSWFCDINGLSGVWLVGFGTGGALSICAGALEARVRGVATLAAPADFDDWARDPRRLIEHALALGIIDPAERPDASSFGRELKSISAASAAPGLAPRPLLVLHGGDDAQVPVLDARVLAEAHGAGDLRIIAGAGHRLREDPRAMATLTGWLERHVGS